MTFDGIRNLVEQAVSGQEPTVPNTSAGTLSRTANLFSTMFLWGLRRI